MGYKGTSKYIGKYKAGQKIARWTVTSGDIVIQREAMLELICECGSIKLISVYTINKGTSTGCKECQNASYIGINNPNWLGGGFVSNSLFGRIKRNAKTRNIVFNITIKDVEKLYTAQDGKCKLTNLPIGFKDHTASLDRIDSSLGYVKKNIQWVHKDINVMKNGYNLEYFVKLCKAVAQSHISTDVSEATSTFVFGNSK